MTNALVILCGGLSTRMGSDKAFLPFGETTLLKYQVERFRPYFSKIYVSVPRQSERPIDYTGHCGCPVIEDVYSQLGPMGGLYSCLCAAPEDILFFAPVDAPFTSPALALEMCGELENRETLETRKAPENREALETREALEMCEALDSKSADRHSSESGLEKYACTIQNPGGRIQPLFAAYTKGCLPVLEELIQKKNYKLRLLLNPDRTIVLDRFLSPEQFFNMNDPQSYYYALQKLAQKMPGAFPAGFSARTTPDKSRIPVLSFTAKSGTGKTTYLEKLIPLLKKEGLRIAVIKHDAHGFQMDKPGKDSYRMTKAGADHMILTSEDQTAAIFTHPGQNPDLEQLLSKIENVDFIITEGYKLGNQKKIQLLRKGYNETPVGNRENVVAYITDFPFDAKVPVFDLNKPENLLPFLKDFIKQQKTQI